VHKELCTCRHIRGRGHVGRGGVVCSMGLGLLVGAGEVRCKGPLGGGGLPFLFVDLDVV
jgi:hypothetical protein